MVQDPLIGQEIDGYRILDELGRGGMGVVFKAEDVALARTVAIKMIARDLARDEAFVRRFRAEARALARVDSPHITSVYALRRTDHGTFIVMEYVGGGTIADRMERGSLSWAEAKPLVLQTLTALEHAHSVGVVHRDIKPGNILLSEGGAVKVTDFGLAKVHTEDPAATVTKGITGTLSYMAPEQVKGARDLDARCDVYALGMTLYEMLTGRLPFDRDLSEYARMRAIVEDEFPPPSRFAPRLSRALDAAVMKALAKDPAVRYPSAAAMCAALEAIPADGPTPPAAPRPGAPSARTRWPLFAATGAFAALLVLLGTWFLGSGPDGVPLSVETDPPGAVVYLDGERVGVTPVSGYEVRRSGGRLRVERVGFAPVDTALVFGEGPLALRFPLRPLPAPPPDAQAAALAVTSEPSRAAVFLDGRRVGETPLRLDSLGVGTVAVRVERAGYRPWEQAAVALRPGEAAAVHAALQPTAERPPPEDRTSTPNPPPPAASGTLVVGVDPAGSVVVAGDRRPGGSAFTLPAGTHAVRCEHPQYGSFQATARVTAGATETITCHFETRVNVQTTTDAGPTWGTVWIDGQNTGRATPTSLTLGPGTHQIEVRREGYRTLDPPRTLGLEAGLQPRTERLVFRIAQE